MAVNENDFEIDRNRLDEEWLRQPQLYIKYVKLAADARLDLSVAKAEASLARSEVASDVRNNPEKYGVKKITNDSVFEAVQQALSVRDADRRVSDASYLVDLTVGAVEAADQKRRALENLVKLLGMEYFHSGGPTPPEEHKQELEEMRKREVRSRGKMRRDEE